MTDHITKALAQLDNAANNLMMSHVVDATTAATEQARKDAEFLVRVARCLASNGKVHYYREAVQEVLDRTAMPNRGDRAGARYRGYA